MTVLVDLRLCLLSVSGGHYRANRHVKYKTSATPMSTSPMTDPIEMPTPIPIPIQEPRFQFYILRFRRRCGFFISIPCQRR